VALTLEESTRISAPAEAIWRRIAEPASWPAWRPQIRHLKSASRGPLADGARIELTIRLRAFSFTLRPVIEVARPPRTLISRARAFGVTARHTLDVEARAEGCLVRERVRLEGPGLFAFRLLGFAPATKAMLAESLKLLRKLVERGL